jgi:hypothetical protein
MILSSILFVLALGIYVALLIRNERRLSGLEQSLLDSQIKNRLLKEEIRKKAYNGQIRKKKASSNGQKSYKQRPKHPKAKKSRERQGVKSR